MKEKSYMLALPGEQEPEGRMEVLRRLKNAPDFKVVTADTEDEGSLELTVEYKGNRYRALSCCTTVDFCLHAKNQFTRVHDIKKSAERALLKFQVE